MRKGTQSRIREILAGANDSDPKSRCPGFQKLSTDDDQFVESVSRLAINLAANFRLEEIYAIHIDHWFGRRWLGFQGKYRGIAGVRSRSLKEGLIVAPFHPHRVHSARRFHLTTDGELLGGDELPQFRVKRRSEDNLNNRIRWNTVYIWYSGDTVPTRRGSLMAYLNDGSESKGFYCSFEHTAHWVLQESRGISREEVSKLLTYTSLNSCPSTTDELP